MYLSKAVVGCIQQGWENFSQSLWPQKAGLLGTRRETGSPLPSGTLCHPSGERSLLTLCRRGMANWPLDRTGGLVSSACRSLFATSAASSRWHHFGGALSQEDAQKWEKEKREMRVFVRASLAMLSNWSARGLGRDGRNIGSWTQTTTLVVIKIQKDDYYCSNLGVRQSKQTFPKSWHCDFNLFRDTLPTTLKI